MFLISTISKHRCTKENKCQPHYKRECSSVQNCKENLFVVFGKMYHLKQLIIMKE